MTTASDHSVGGDNGNWMLFDRTTNEGQPLIVLARTGNSLVDQTLRQKFVTIVHGEADAALISDVGMPQHTDRLYPVEEHLAQKLAELGTGIFHVASVTGSGQRRMIYAHEAPLDFGPLIRLFDVAGYSLRISHPTDVAILAALVSPTAVEQQLNGDRSVISNLEQNGDEGNFPRKTDFWFYGARAALEELTAALQPRGFSVDHWLADTGGVVLTCATAVNFPTFQELTPVLVRTAEQHDVSYDGWETFIVRSEIDAASIAKPARQSFLSKLFGLKKN